MLVTEEGRLCGTPPFLSGECGDRGGAYRPESARVSSIRTHRGGRAQKKRKRERKLWSREKGMNLKKAYPDDSRRMTITLKKGKYRCKRVREQKKELKRSNERFMKKTAH